MRLLLLLVVNLFLLLSCKKYKPADAAFFVRASKVSVATTVATQGSSSSKITDLFLYVNGKFQGAYPVGNLMPIVNKGQKANISVFAGIKNNGISDTRVSWIFYDYIEWDTLVQTGKTIEHAFTFKYGAGVKFAWLENFDSNAGFTIRKSSLGSDTTFKIAAPADSYEGKSLELGVVATDTARFGRIESNLSYTLPVGSTDIYLEINYKCNQPFTVGIVSDGEDEKSALVVNPSATWNKIYIQLSSVVSTPPSSASAHIYFEIFSSSDNHNPKLFLDNIKLVHF